MPATAIQRGVCVEAAGARLAGWLCLPPDPKGFVLFASSRDLMRIDRRQVDLSEALNRRGLGTLLFDLVETTDSAEVEQDVGLLAGRLIGGEAVAGVQTATLLLCDAEDPVELESARATAAHLPGPSPDQAGGARE